MLSLGLPADGSTLCTHLRLLPAPVLAVKPPGRLEPHSSQGPSGGCRAAGLASDAAQSGEYPLPCGCPDWWSWLGATRECATRSHLLTTAFSRTISWAPIASTVVVTTGIPICEGGTRTTLHRAVLPDRVFLPAAGPFGLAAHPTSNLNMWAAFQPELCGFMPDKSSGNQNSFPFVPFSPFYRSRRLRPFDAYPRDVSDPRQLVRDLLQCAGNRPSTCCACMATSMGLKEGGGGGGGERSRGPRTRR